MSIVNIRSQRADGEFITTTVTGNHIRVDDLDQLHVSIKKRGRETPTFMASRGNWKLAWVDDGSFVENSCDGGFSLDWTIGGDSWSTDQLGNLFVINGSNTVLAIVADVWTVVKKNDF